MGDEEDRKRVAVVVEGKVQGVGFRPFVYGQAVANNLSGFVCNTPQSVYIEAEGRSADIKAFLDSVKHHPPQQSVIKHMSVAFLPVKQETGFKIAKSLQETDASLASAEVCPDMAVCSQCIKELFSPQDRRYLFPFINCTNCGPRFTIVKSLPYDRKHTSMYRFMMCPDCYAEYVNPFNRRFNAQPDCCFVCGPEYILFDTNRQPLGSGQHAIKKAATLIEKGCIVAVKGIGGYHLFCDATNRSAVKTIRKRKQRGDKPFAVMARNIKVVCRYCVVNAQEKKLLSSWRAPVVILKKKVVCRLPVEIAPRNKYLGCLLPYAPVHHLLFHYGNFDIVVATSANMSDQPIIYRDTDALEKLIGMADYVLSHNRDIEVGCDDSVAKVERCDNKTHIIRRARGYVPEPVKMPFSFKHPVFAAGANEKNTFSLGWGNCVVTSQYLGNLEHMGSFRYYIFSYEHFRNLFRFSPGLIACDLHPDYASSRFAKGLSEKQGIPLVGVQHHHAHIASCMLENNISANKVIGVAIDGTGYGEKGDIRGCEFMIADYKGYERYAWLDYVALPGGDIAVREVWRTGLSYLYNTFGESFVNTRVPLLTQVAQKKISFVVEMLKNNINCPAVSSMGRLFDSISAIIGLQQEISYDAQAAIELEMVMEKTQISPYRFAIKPDTTGAGIVLDPRILIRQVVKDVGAGVNKGVISYRFHKAIVVVITEICKRIKQERNISIVVLSGGSFQNSFLLNNIYRSLSKEGFTVYTNSRFPSNDGGISVGQVVVAHTIFDGKTVV